MNLIDNAIKYAEKGLSVVPLQPNSKRPAIKFKNRLPLTVDEIKELWTVHPDYGIAIETTLLIIIDIDSEDHGNGDGFASFRELPQEWFPPTLSYTSPSGGKHLIYFKHPRAVLHCGNGSFQNWKPAIDVISGANSVTPFPPTNGYSWDNQNDIVTAPLELMQAISAGYAAKKQAANGGHLTTDYSKIGQKRWTGILLDELVSGFDYGSRNVLMTSLAGKMFGVGAEPETVYELMLFANDHSKPPLSTNELNNIFKSILKREVAKRERQENGTN